VHLLNVPPSQKIVGPNPCAAAGRAEAINIATITTHTLKIKGVPPDSLSTRATATKDGSLSCETLPRPGALLNVTFVLHALVRHVDEAPRMVEKPLEEIKRQASTGTFVVQA
jgi:hypothetical protein